MESDAMDAMDEFYIYENRLASFTDPQVVATAPKRRASNASTQSRSPKIMTWPHKSIRPVDVSHLPSRPPSY